MTLYRLLGVSREWPLGKAAACALKGGNNRTLLTVAYMAAMAAYSHAIH